MKKRIKLTEKEKELIESIRIIQLLKGRRFLDLELYVRDLFEQLLIKEN
ncbi:MAG: hypothetical protein FWH23_02260 [Bacteroidales bacterium]|nr:hypothetical protein [Bacteroidales bacterium]MCL2132986.1 hypothetical protein [Bacteroidales bacterium]